MKVQSLVAFLLALAAAPASASLPVCKASTASTKHLSDREVQACRNKIAQNHFSLTTCQAPGPTVKVVRNLHTTYIVHGTIQPAPVTKKVTKTLTETGKPHTLPTVTLTATTTKVAKTTKTDSTTVTTFETTTETSTATAVATTDTTITTTETSFLPWSSATCDPVTVYKRAKGKITALPSKCSPLLTATKGVAKATTITVTKHIAPVTQTSLVKGTATPTVTRTVTARVYKAGTTIRAPETTKTLTVTRTQTDYVLTSVILALTSTFSEITTTTETTTTTSTSTAKATATSDVCADGGYESFLVGTYRLANSYVELADTIDVNSGVPQEVCCQACYGAPECAWFRINLSGQCEVYRTKQGVQSSCTSDRCVRGKTFGILYSNDGTTYYRGDCLSAIGG